MKRYLGMFFTLLACGACRVDRENHEDSPVSSPEPQWSQAFANLADVCARTGGSWNRFLTSCICENGKIFQVHDGCKNFDKKLLDNESLSFTFKFDSLSASHREDLESKDKSLLLKGWTFSPERLIADIRIVFRAVRTAKDTIAWNDERSYPEKAYEGVVDLSNALAEAIFDTDACAKMLQPDGGHGWREVCSHAITVLKIIRADNKDDALDVWATNISPNCTTYCSVEAFRVKENIRVSFENNLMGYVSYRRFLSAEDQHGRRLTLHLDPTGKIDGISAEKRELKKEGPQIFAETRWVFNGLGELVDQRERRSADRSSLDEIVKKLATQTTSGPSAIVFDTGVDIRQSSLHPFLKLENSIDFKTSLFGVDSHPIEHLIEALDQRTWFHNPHGTGMASLLVKKMKEARLHFLSSSFTSYPMTLAEMGPYIEKHMKKMNPRVVNMSFSWPLDESRCEAVFGRLAKAFPETLFVVAAGNMNVSKVDFMCPGSLAKTASNILVVAGYSGDSLDPSSIKDADYSHVALPFRGKCLVPDQTNATESTCTGTSVSAATLSNLALRYFSRNPDLKVADFVRHLQDQAQPAKLAVKWRAYIDPEQFKE